MNVINLFGGPGTGKSTTASALFAHMKWRHHNVELVSEYAKEVTWDRRHKILEDQLYMTSKQNRKLDRIRDQVDWSITDSPILMGLAYAKPDYMPNYYPGLVEELYDTYNNINIFLLRTKPYQPIGRNQTEQQARDLDSEILSILKMSERQFHVVPADENAHTTIYNDILGL